jgi:hypothetical protein
MQLFADRRTGCSAKITNTACWVLQESVKRERERSSPRALRMCVWCWRIYCGGELESSGGDAINTVLNDLFTFRILTFAYNVMF